MTMNTFRKAAALAGVAILGAAQVACNHGTQSETSLTLEQKIAQKLAVDMRYFCSEPLSEGEKCRTPVTQMPKALGDIIADTQVGGVILFAENFSTPETTLRLVNDLQQAAARTSATPLLVATDQEGGKVARLPRHWAAAFSGNMAVAATGERAPEFADKVGGVMAEQLSALGIFINYAPTVDVNANPLNPVINTRSYSEDPKRVAELGAAYTRGLQAGGVAATLKHFPGHGDTHVDSHTGLPLVAHPLAQIKAQDLYPFKSIISEAAPALVMTAHIQFPALDNSTLTTHTGEQAVVPATLSRKIMTDLLRHEFGYQGVTTTDALDMVGVAMLLPDPVERTVKAFAAGVDIALMPFKIRTPADGEKLQALITAVADAVRAGNVEHLTEAEIDASVDRILALKKQLPINAWLAKPLAERIAHTQTVFDNKSHRALESAIALAAVTHVAGSQESLAELCAKPSRVSEAGNTNRRLVVVAPTEDVQQAMAQTLVAKMPELATQAFTLKDYADPARRDAMLNANCVMVIGVTPPGSPVDMGGMDDVIDQMKAEAGNNPEAWAAIKERQREQVGRIQFSLLRALKERKVPRIFVSMRAPYEAKTMAPVSDAVYATYDFNSANFETVNGPVSVRGPAYDALVAVLSGRAKAQGNLPVTVFDQAVETAGAQ
ncbi:glycoside hydrolase family 3 protein [Simiduia sp. 21SJ11W-1]|uniref:glycoside hydrolase family 3 protein n=1 Tax=Simiduia sp. 21SJ11W-1 TaxID=2909669 RepID=UPI00209F9ABF|nr:glycoside hydrolase family 3 protein [Simiduia sp. 21SJ11W-1]UTA48376.1 glycoside hydrolase family 3 protein [Simiduia sp. 21SJ11W-1]